MMVSVYIVVYDIIDSGPVVDYDTLLSEVQ